MHSYVHSCVCTGICVHAGRFEKGIASFSGCSGIANRSIMKINGEIDTFVMCYVIFDGLSDKRRKLCLYDSVTFKLKFLHYLLNVIKLNKPDVSTNGLHS